MIRTILAATLSATLALPTLTAPAQAHQTNYAHQHRNNNAATAAVVLGGLAALLLLQKEAEKRKDNTRTRRHAKILPDQCFRRFDTRRGVVRGYAARCMQRNVARPAALPPQCIRQVRIDRGVRRNLYTARCMRQQGWTSRAARR